MRFKAALLFYLGLVWGRMGLAAEFAPMLYHNSVLAFEDGRYDELLRHWFLYQSLEPAYQSPALQEGLLSLLWAAVDRLDLCPESLPADDPGSRLWPLVLYNQLAAHHRNYEGKRTDPADKLESFEKGRQQRRVAWNQSLDPEEVLSFRSYRDSCKLPERLVANFGRNLRADPKERARSMLDLLEKVESATRLASGQAWIKMRKLTLKLYISDQKDGIEESSIPLIRELIQADKEFLRALDPTLRSYILQLYGKLDDTEERRRAILLRWLDLSAEFEDGPLIERVLHAITIFDPEDKLTIWRQDRGLRLLQLSEKDLFSEGASIALARAYEAYDQRDLLESLRMFANASRLAPKARAEGAGTIALNWIRHILIQYRFDPRFLDFLRRYLPKPQLKAMMQDLVWTSALIGERAILAGSFYEDFRNYRLRQVHPYLEAIAGRRFQDFMRRFKQGLIDEPRPTVALAQEIGERVRLEPYPVLQALLPLLEAIQSSLEAAVHSKQLRLAKGSTVIESYDSLLVHGRNLSQARADRQVKGGAVIELGSIRVPPARVVPWDFPATELVSVDVFEKIPYRLQHRHVAEQVELTWHLGPY